MDKKTAAAAAEQKSAGGEKQMDMEALYLRLMRIQARGEIGNAYGGCGTVEEDSDVLVDFFDCIMEKYKDALPP